MPDAWGSDAPSRPESASNNEAKLALCARWVLKGMHHSEFTRHVLEGCVRAGLLKRQEASRHAKKHLSWVDAYEIFHGRRYAMPSKDTVRPNWREIGHKWLTEAERKAWDEEGKRLRAQYPEGTGMADSIHRAEAAQ